MGTPAEITGHNDTQVSMMILLLNWFTTYEISIVYIVAGDLGENLITAHFCSLKFRVHCRLHRESL